MRQELINQFSHFWRTYRSVCNDFDISSWKNSGYGLTQPSRLALHIIQSTKYYIEDKSPLKYAAGNTIEINSSDLEKSDLPELEDILFLLTDIEKKTEGWLETVDFNANNDKFPWTGKTYGSVVLFLLRHSQYHLGEMNSLLNEQLHGDAEDHFAKEL